jgi:4-aminobutyrate aminotransferase-like enzyme
VELARRLSQKLPNPLEVVFFVNSGSEANDLALRLARAYTGSQNTIVVDGAYHGHTLATLEVSPYKYEHSSEFFLQPPASGSSATPGPHIWKVPCPDTFRGLHRDASEAADTYADYVRQACVHYVQKRNEMVGAFILEGGMSVAGVILPPPTYLKQCVEAVHQAGGVYIADEVQTGFGRLGSCFWAFQYSNSAEDDSVLPDVVTMGKPFGNGMPLAAVVTTREISEAFESKGVEYFNTFGGNPVCAAAGLAVLDVIELENLQERAQDVGDYLKSKFVELQATLNIIGDIRGSGLFLGVELVRNRETLEPASEETSFLCTILKEKYFVLTSIDGFHENVLVVKPPMSFSRADADEFVSCFERAIRHDLAAVQDVAQISKTPT